MKDQIKEKEIVYGCIAALGIAGVIVMFVLCYLYVPFH